MVWTNTIGGQVGNGSPLTVGGICPHSLGGFNVMVTWPGASANGFVLDANGMALYPVGFNPFQCYYLDNDGSENGVIFGGGASQGYFLAPGVEYQWRTRSTFTGDIDAVACALGRFVARGITAGTEISVDGDLPWVRVTDVPCRSLVVTSDSVVGVGSRDGVVHVGRVTEGGWSPMAAMSGDIGACTRGFGSIAFTIGGQVYLADGRGVTAAGSGSATAAYSDGEVALVGLNGGGLRRKLIGGSWEGTQLSSNTFTVIARLSGVFYALSVGGVMYSSPDGSVWTLMQSGMAGVVVPAQDAVVVNPYPRTDFVAYSDSGAAILTGNGVWFMAGSAPSYGPKPKPPVFWESLKGAEER